MEREQGNGKMMDDEGKERQRVGLQNVRARLDAQCGGTLDIVTNENGTIVTIYIPK